MSGKTLEDVLVDKKYKKVVKKKSNLGIIIILGSFIIAIIALGIFAWKYIESKKEVTAKDMFLEYAFDNNIDRLFKNNLYSQTYKRLANEDFSTDTNINFSTTSQIEGFENFEFSKFTLDNNLVKKATNNRVFTNSIIKYLGNDIFDLKTISDNNNFAINSEQVVTKYISGTTNQMNNLIKEVTGFEVNLNFGLALVNDISNSEEIELTDKNVQTLKKIFTKIVDKNIKEENVTSKEIIVDSNGEQIQTVAYSAVIDKNSVLQITKDIIEELKEDKIADRLITRRSSINIFDVGSAEYYLEPGTLVENVIDSSDFIVGEEQVENEILENIIENPTGGTINPSGTQNEDLEIRNTVVNPDDDTVMGYVPPVREEPQEPENPVINVVTPVVPDNNIPVNTTNTVNVTNTTNVIDTTNTTNTVKNTVTNNVVNNNVSNNISSDVIIDKDSNGTLIPIASVEINAQRGKSKRFGADIQIIQNPNLTTEEDRQAAEENKEALKEETEELFSSITNAIETNAQIVDNADITDSSKEMGYEYELVKFVLFGNKMNITYEEYTNYLDNIYKKIQNKDFNNLVITLYVANEKTIKIIIEDENNYQMEIDFVNINDAESKIKIVSLNNKEVKNGKMFEFYKSQRETACSYDVASSKIEEGKIVEKIWVNLMTQGTLLGNSLNNELKVQLLKGKEESFNISIGNTMNFENQEIGNLNNENCLYLNSLSNEEYYAIVNAVKDKTLEVLAEKMTDLNLIDINTENDFVNRVQEEAENQREEENSISKDDARNIIIARVGDLMGEAEANNISVDLNLLTNLTIDGYNVSSSVSQDEALVILNGHEFIIDSEFTIYDVE